MPHLKPNAAWYLVQLKPNSRHIAERNLWRQGFRTFLPHHRETRRVRGAFVTKAHPLFPGYLFVLLDMAGAGWRSVNSTLGVSRLVSFGSLPSPVPNGLVEELSSRCDNDGNLTMSRALRTGDEITLSKGPFADFLATIEKIDADRRVWLLLDIMGRKTRITASAADLEVW